jgi:hypothetical protein
MSRTRRTLARIALAFAALTVAAAAVVFAPFSFGSIDPIRIELARFRGKAVRNRIHDELATRTQPNWAGRYLWSNGFEHRYLDISSTSFFYEHRSCTGTRELVYGSVRQDAGERLRLSPSFRGDAREAEVHAGDRTDFTFSVNMYSVAWGTERFLVPAESMPQFCALASANGWNAMEYATNPRLLRADDPGFLGTPHVSGLPVVPEEFRRFLPE